MKETQQTADTTDAEPEERIEEQEKTETSSGETEVKEETKEEEPATTVEEEEKVEGKETESRPEPDETETESEGTPITEGIRGMDLSEVRAVAIGSAAPLPTESVEVKVDESEQNAMAEWDQVTQQRDEEDAKRKVLEVSAVPCLFLSLSLFPLCLFVLLSLCVYVSNSFAVLLSLLCAFLTSSVHA